MYSNRCQSMPVELNAGRQFVMLQVILKKTNCKTSVSFCANIFMTVIYFNVISVYVHVYDI